MTILTSSFLWFVALHALLVLALMLAQSKVLDRWKLLTAPKRRAIFRRCVAVCWPFFLAFSIWWAWGDAPAPLTSERTAIPAPYFRCLYYGFPDGDVLPDTKGNGGTGKSGGMFDDPAGCMADFEDLVKDRAPHVVILTGRADRRELSLQKRWKYGSNEELAYQRAKSVKDHQAKEWKGQTVLLAAGPVYFTGASDPLLLQRDRSVEIRVYWEPPQPQESNSAATLFNVDHELALLAIIIALSTYLAAISVFLRQRINELGATVPVPASADIAKRKLRLLALADVPLILAGALLFAHVYYAWPSLRASVQLLAMGVVTLLLYHLSQWGKSGHSWWEL